MVKLTDIENDILHCINVKITNNIRVSLTDVANECHVAKSTVVKLSKKLGYSGFVEMYYQMSDKQKKKSLSEKKLKKH